MKSQVGCSAAFSKGPSHFSSICVAMLGLPIFVPFLLKGVRVVDQVVAAELAAIFELSGGVQSGS